MRIIIIFMFMLLSAGDTNGCPLCVGKIKPGSQPFFDSESSMKFDVPVQQSKKYLAVYEQYIKQKDGKK